MSTLISSPFPVFTDTDGLPLENGYIDIGVAGLNPLSNPIQVYWDEALTIPATNIRTTRGYPARNGSAAFIYAPPGDFSLMIRNKNGVVIFSNLNVIDNIIVIQNNILNIDGRLTTVETDYAPLASPALTGTPTAPTPALTDDSTTIATTAFVAAVADGASGWIEYLGATDTTWVAPAGVTEVTVNAVGQGGTGATALASTRGGGGGGSGAWCRARRITVVPGTSYPIVLSTTGNSTAFGMTFGKGANGSGVTGGAGGTGSGGASNGFAGGSGHNADNANGGGGGGIGGVGGNGSSGSGYGGGGGTLTPAQQSNPGFGFGSGRFGGRGGSFFATLSLNGADGAGAAGAQQNLPAGTTSYGGGGGGGGTTAGVTQAPSSGGAPLLRIDW
jgi:hypothetical protein